jgi:hypothetical protein
VRLQTRRSASPTFSLDYYTNIANGVAKSDVKQSEVNFQVEYTLKEKTIAALKENVDSPLSLFVNYSHGFKRIIG